MDSTRWERIQSLFHDAAELPQSERRIFLESNCADDPGIVTEVIGLLQQDAEGNSLLDGDVARLADKILNDPAAAIIPFKEFGPYKIQRVLGEGGMGIVYLAQREDLGSSVAIKILRDAWLSPARRERFAIEQRTLAQLNHASIARIYDADTSPDGTPFFVMEYVEGAPLTEFCEQHRCSVRKKLELFRAVCEAVLYAHQHAVIHRDLKPSNIFVKHDGSIRLLDFGISKHLENLGSSVDQTVTGLRLMTPAYAAPEQIRGEPVGIQTDVYSLGVILYQLLAGKLPFDIADRTPAQAEKILTEQEPAKPSQAAKSVSVVEGENQSSAVQKIDWPDLDVLCLTAMHKDVGRRYQSVEALIRDIDHYLLGEPLEAHGDSARYRMGKFVSRNHRAVTAVAIVFTLVLALVTFYTVRLARARNAALAEAARAERIQRFMLNLFQGGDESAGPADNLRVITLLDRGVQEASGLAGEPAVQAELFQTLGSIYEKLGKFEQADSLYSSALEKRKFTFGDDSVEVAESLVSIGLLRDNQARLGEAEKLVTDGLAMDKRHLEPNHPAIARATTALGKVLEDRGAYDPAIKQLDEAVRLLSRRGDQSPELAASLYELASTHFYAGHYDTSEALNQRVLVMDKKIYGEHHPRVADVLINLGAIKYDLGHYPEAEAYDRQALEIVQTWYGKDNPETASDLTILARALIAQTRYTEADDLLQRSLAIKERVYGEVHPSVASSLNELGNAASRQGNYDAAEKYFKRMADIYRSVYGEHHYLLATAMSNLGSVYLGRKDWKSAEDIFRRVVPLYTETLSATHVNTGIARTKLGRALLGEHHYADAAIESRAGYDILVKQMDPQVRWLVSARKDLVEEYLALNEPAQAEEFRIEVSAIDTKKPAVPAKP